MALQRLVLLVVFDGCLGSGTGSREIIVCGVCGVDGSSDSAFLRKKGSDALTHAVLI